MKLLIDMNLSPDWSKVFINQGWQASHWSFIGEPTATDSTIMDWARQNGYTVFTHDLDFGTLLALTHAQGPSVIQIRTQDVMPQFLGERLCQILKQSELMIQKGALITIDETKSRIRILPLLEK